MSTLDVLDGKALPTYRPRIVADRCSPVAVVWRGPRPYDIGNGIGNRSTEKPFVLIARLLLDPISPLS